MGNVIVDLTMSLDGFIAGADDGPELPLGRGGERLFTWMGAGAGAQPRAPVPPADRCQQERRGRVDDAGRRDPHRPANVRYRRRLGGGAPHRRADLRRHARGAHLRQVEPAGDLRDGAWSVGSSSPRRPPATAPSRSRGRASRSSSSAPASSTRSRSASRRCCSARACGCSSISATYRSSSSRRA